MRFSPNAPNAVTIHSHAKYTGTFGDFTSISSVVWSELGPALPFPPMRVLGV